MKYTFTGASRLGPGLEVDVDRFEGNLVFGSASGSDEDLATAEQRAQQLARAAIAEYQSCGGR